MKAGFACALVSSNHAYTLCCWLTVLLMPTTLADTLKIEKNLHAGGVRDAAVSAVPGPPGAGGRLPARRRQHHRGALHQAHMTMPLDAICLLLLKPVEHHSVSCLGALCAHLSAHAAMKCGGVR